MRDSNVDPAGHVPPCSHKRGPHPAGNVAHSATGAMVLSLAEVPDDRQSLVGGKAANLARLLRAGFPVPPGFCLTTAAFEAFLAACPKREELRAALSLSPATRPDELAALSQRLTTWLAASAMPAEVEAAVLGAWRRLEANRRPAGCSRVGTSPVSGHDGNGYAVRSSATVEDAAEQAFAGQFDSFLDLRGLEALLNGIRKCWQSLYSARALAYQARHGLEPGRAAMAVIVQVMVPAEAAGVLFTLDPATGDAGQIVIESTPGLGDGLVSGRVVPERVILDKATLRVLTAAPSNLGKDCLSHSCARRLGRLARRVERQFGRPQDLEWAVADGHVYLLQARPVTVRCLPGSGGGATSSPTCRPAMILASPLRPDRGSVSCSRSGLPERHPNSHTLRCGSPTRGPGPGAWEDRQIWSNLNAGEVAPDVMTPMTWSLIQRFLAQLARGLFRLLGADGERAPSVGLVAGRIYFNVNTGWAAIRPFARLLWRIPNAAKALGGAPQIEGGNGTLDLREEDVPDLGFRWPRYLGSWPRILSDLIAHSPRRGDRWTTSLKAAPDPLAEVNLERLAAGELGRCFGRLLDDGFQGWDLLYLVMQASALPWFQWACHRWLDDPDLAQGYRLFAALGGLPETEAALALWRLATLAHADPVTETALLGTGDWAAVSASLAGTGPGRRFLEAWAAFMAQHGHHCRGELELFNPRWSERPDYVLGLVRAYLGALDQTDPLEKQRRLARERERLTAQCCQRLRNPLKRWIFSRSLRRAQQLAANREAWKNEAVRHIAALRRVLLALGEQLCRAGVLDRPDDVFFLEATEVEPVASGQAPIAVRAVVTQRRCEYEQNLTLKPPPVVKGRFEPEAEKSPALNATAGTLTGIPVFPGVVTGPARVILRADDHEHVRPGEILVAPFTDPAWTPYFLTAAAVVMDLGGILSHGSIVAREFGLPAVTNVGEATQRIRTGDRLQVDGARGRVTILERASTP